MVQVVLMGSLEGHQDWVTSISTTENPDILLSVSRDKSLLIWKLTRDEVSFGEPFKRLTGHNHFIQDFAVSQDGQFAITASWDKSLRLWDLNTGETTRRFVGHTHDVMSVAFSPDNRQIISCSRDKTIKIWNTLGECKYTIQTESHSDWVSCVRVSPSPETPVFITCGWDKLIKVWDLSSCKLRTNHIGHRGNVNAVAVSPDGSLCASGGKDGVTMLWDLSEGKYLYSLEANDTINALTFSPTRFWLCAATSSSIKIWDLESKKIVCELKPQFTEVSRKARDPECMSLSWSLDGSYLFSGYTDSQIRVWSVRD